MSASLRYVILRHELPLDSARPSHFDLMLEAGETLRTWSLPNIDDLIAGASISATSLPDHRLAYLDYEGPISQNRGLVARWDSGAYSIITETLDSLTLSVSGIRLHGTLTLHTTTEPNTWTLTYQPSSTPRLPHSPTPH